MIGTCPFYLSHGLTVFACNCHRHKPHMIDRLPIIAKPTIFLSSSPQSLPHRPPLHHHLHAPHITTYDRLHPSSRPPHMAAAAFTSVSPTVFPCIAITTPTAYDRYYLHLSFDLSHGLPSSFASSSQRPPHLIMTVFTSVIAMPTCQCHVNLPLPCLLTLVYFTSPQ